MHEPARSEAAGTAEAVVCRGVEEGTTALRAAPAAAAATRPPPVADARAARLARLERAVQSGTYRPDARAIASAMLRAIDAAAGEVEETPPAA